MDTRLVDTGERLIHGLVSTPRLLGFCPTEFGLPGPSSAVLAPDVPSTTPACCSYSSIFLLELTFVAPCIIPSVRLLFLLPPGGGEPAFFSLTLLWPERRSPELSLFSFPAETRVLRRKFLLMFRIVRKFQGFPASEMNFMRSDRCGFKSRDFLYA